MQEIVRITTFDSGHRVMNEKMKCFNIHGHTYICHVHFSFSSMAEIGYAIDFKEIKRVGMQWIDDLLDHGFIANPHDEEILDMCKKLGSKAWVMSLNGRQDPNEQPFTRTGLKYCNPTVENIAKEILLAMELLFLEYKGLIPTAVTLYETPKCYTIVRTNDIDHAERLNFREYNSKHILEYAKEKGIVEYDDRK